MIDKNVLRENDIRGIAGGNITEILAFRVGASFGTYLINNNKFECVIGYDNRTSGEVLVKSLINGLISTGINVKFIGMVTTPILNYATIHLNIEAGIIVTASHNPADNNGFKIFGESFLHLKRNELEKVYDLILNPNYIKGEGTIEKVDVIKSYINMLYAYILNGKKRLKIAIDPGNGTTSLFIKDIIKNFNIEPLYINSESDGTFPKHNPDPNNDKNLVELKELVIKEKCDFGVAYDGDGDRVGIVDELGNTIESDKLIAIFAKSIIPISDNKKVILDVKCSKALVSEIEKLNAEPIMLKNGSAYIETILKEKDVLIGGEYSGHIFFRDRYYGYDDGIYAGLRLFEILSNNDIKCSELSTGYKQYFNTPEIRIKVSDDKKFDIINSVKDYVIDKGYNYIDIDGVRAEFNDGWVLVRCSNTEPSITMRFEAETESRLQELQDEFNKLLTSLM